MKQGVSEVRCAKDGGIWTITIDNQGKRNAFSGEMVYQLQKHLDEADASPSVRAVILTGAGDVAFSSGHDLVEMLSHLEHAFGKEANAGFIRPQSMRIPVIAAVNGFAYAAGFILAMSCDLRVASENARFATPGAKVGLLPIGGQLSRLFHLLPQGKLLELLYTGDPLSAHEALALGFVNRVVPVGKAVAAARELANRISSNSPAVITQIKRGVDIAQRHGIEAGEAFEWATAELLRSSPDMREGIAAFVEKRAPRFADRD
jgi:enoyl-CoA hydratase/carnithine racemase